MAKHAVVLCPNCKRSMDDNGQALHWYCLYCDYKIKFGTATVEYIHGITEEDILRLYQLKPEAEVDEYIENYYPAWRITPIDKITQAYIYRKQLMC